MHRPMPADPLDDRASSGGGPRIASRLRRGKAVLQGAIGPDPQVRGGMSALASYQDNQNERHEQRLALTTKLWFTLHWRGVESD